MQTTPGERSSTHNQRTDAEQGVDPYQGAVTLRPTRYVGTWNAVQEASLHYI